MGSAVTRGQQHIEESTANGWKERWKKIGMIGFLLFLLKGIIWLVVGYLILG